MTQLIRNGRVVSDEWKTLTLTENDTPLRVKLPVGPVLVPLSVWRTRRAELIHREYEHGWPLGIWLSAGESAEALARDIDDFTVIAVKVDKLTGDSGHEAASLLRERYAYRGELRATGDISRRDLPSLQQAGFDAFRVPANKSIWNTVSNWFNFRPVAEPAQLLAAAV